MRNRFYKMLVLALAFAFALCLSASLTACGKVSEQSYLSFNSLTVQGNNVYGTVSNATEVFEFENEITADKMCEYVVSLDEFGIQTSLTKTVPLAIGDKTFYIFESVDGAPKNTFIVTIRRKPVYTVTFNSNCGTPIQSQTVEEGYLANMPTEQITKLGYTFTGWDFDFTAPITQNITKTRDLAKAQP